MDAATADAVRRHEGSPGANRESRLIHLVAERKGRLLGTQEQLVTNAIAEFVLRVVRRILRGRVAPRTTLDRDDVEPFVRQLVGHDRSGPPKTDNDDIFLGKFVRHGLPQRLFGVQSARPAMLTGGSGNRSL